MILAREVQEIRDVRTGRLKNISVGAWMKGWWPWGVGGTSNFLFCHTNTEILYVCSFNMVGYERRLSDILGSVEGASFSDGRKDPGKVISFSRLYGRVYFSTSWCYLSKDLNFEHRMFAYAHGVLVCGYNMEQLSALLLASHGLYVERPSCLERVQRCSTLTVLTPHAPVSYNNLHLTQEEPQVE